MYHTHITLNNTDKCKTQKHNSNIYNNAQRKYNTKQHSYNNVQHSYNNIKQTNIIYNTHKINIQHLHV